jgi:hypothetical protein
LQCAPRNGQVGSSISAGCPFTAVGKPTLRRLWYAEIADETAASDLTTKMPQHDDVQSADLPARRGLVLAAIVRA